MRIRSLKRLQAAAGDDEYIDFEKAIASIVPRANRLSYNCNRRPGPEFKLYVAFEFNESGRFNPDEYIDRISDAVKQIAAKSGIEPDSVNVVNTSTKTSRLVTDTISGVKGLEYTVVVSINKYSYTSRKNQIITNEVIMRYESFGCGSRIIIQIGY